MYERDVMCISTPVNIHAHEPFAVHVSYHVLRTPIRVNSHLVSVGTYKKPQQHLPPSTNAYEKASHETRLVFPVASTDEVGPRSEQTPPLVSLPHFGYTSSYSSVEHDAMRLVAPSPPPPRPVSTDRDAWDGHWAQTIESTVAAVLFAPAPRTVVDRVRLAGLVRACAGYGRSTYRVGVD